MARPSGGGTNVAWQPTRPQPDEIPLDPTVRSSIDALIEEGFEIFDQFDRTTRDRGFHPFVAADYVQVLDALLELRETMQTSTTRRRAGPPRFLELGSATGVIAIMADLIGFDAMGIELDASLVTIARELAVKYKSRARFAVGSFLPTGYRWKSKTSDNRMGTIGTGPSAYLELGRALDDFDLVYAYPWDGEAPMIEDLATRYGDPGARLLLMDSVSGLRIASGGQ